MVEEGEGEGEEERVGEIMVERGIGIILGPSPWAPDVEFGGLRLELLTLPLVRLLFTSRLVGVSLNWATNSTG
jgi:hypothetical protein